jgi:hypothetical protein
MNTDRKPLSHPWHAGLLCAITAVLVACGGGDLLTAGGVGSGGTGVAEGTVTGFGSVIVDGVAYAETNAAVVTDNETGVPNNADLQLGQRVRLVHAPVNGRDTATRVEVLPQLRGPVTAVANTQGQLQVMGQVVQVQGTATQSQTVLAGIDKLSALVVGDVVEAHGSWVRNTTTARHELMVTRLEKVTSADAVRLLSGVVHGANPQTQGTQWNLNADDGIPVLSATPPTLLGNGTLVRLWVTSGALGSRPLLPLRTVVADLGSSTPNDTGADIRLSAQASDYAPGARTVSVQGVTLSLPVGLAVDEAALLGGGYVTAQISRQGGKWQLVSASVEAGATALTRETELKGVIGGVDFAANPVVFALRGTTVQATPAVLEAGCLTAGTGDVYLQVQGRMPAGSAALQASRVQCKSQAPSAEAVIERQGTVLSVDTPLRSLVWRVGTGANTATLTANWDANSYFQKSPDELPGLTVEIEGIQNGSQLRIRRLRLSPPSHGGRD